MKHNEDLDFLRGIGIIFVVLGHCFTTAIVAKYNIIGMGKDIIYTFHMPLFFIVSGYLQGLKPYKLEQLKKFSGRQMQKLLFPYFTWSILLYVFYFVLNKMEIVTINENITLNPISLILDIFSFKVVTGNVLWFVYILFLLSIVSYFIHSFINNRTINVLFVLVVFFLGIAANSYLQDELFVLKRFLVMWIYYEIGVFIGKYIDDISFKANWRLNITLVGLYALLFIGYTNTSGIVGKTLKLLCALIAVFILYSLSKYDRSWFYRIVNYIGKRTLYVYYLHNPYIVLILATVLTTFTKINIIISIVISFSLGCIIPLIIGELVLSRIKAIKLAFLGESS